MSEARQMPEANRPEVDYNAPVSSADIPLLTTFGVALPDNDITDWLEDFNQKVATGSRDLSGSSPEAAREIITSRKEVVSELKALPPQSRDFLSQASKGTPPRSGSLLAGMRAFYHSEHDVDALRVAKANQRSILLSPKLISGRLDAFKGLGLVPEKMAVEAMNYHEATVAAKLHDLSDLSLPAVYTINSCPALIHLDKVCIKERLDNLTDLGFDALKAAKVAPQILKYSPDPLRTKFLLLEAAFRYWGAADPRARAITFAQEAPSQFSNAPHRVRTFIRLGSAILSPDVVPSIGRKTTLPLLMLDINVTLGSYLEYQSTPEEDRPTFTTVYDFYRYSKAQEKALGRPALKKLIAAHTDDPVIQFHNSKSRRKSRKSGRSRKVDPGSDTSD